MSITWQWSEGVKAYTGVSSVAKPTINVDRDTLAYAYDTEEWFIFDGAIWYNYDTTMQPKSSIICADQSVVWANNALVNTLVNIDVVKPSIIRSEYMVTVYNPSAVTDITVKVQPIATSLADATRYSSLTQWTFPKGQTTSKLVHGIFNGLDVRFACSNDTALGAAEGFTATLRVREV